jgi:hypothetical protein
VAELAAAGVRRISFTTSLYRAAMTGFLDAISEVKDTGQFGFLDRCVTTPELTNSCRFNRLGTTMTPTASRPISAMRRCSQMPAHQSAPASLASRITRRLLS